MLNWSDEKQVVCHGDEFGIGSFNRVPGGPGLFWRRIRI